MAGDFLLDPATFSIERPFLDRAAIAEVLPHRDAMALVDGIFHMDPTTYTVDDPSTPYQAVASYNNFYEFGLDKDEPAQYAHTLRTRPWTITVEGERYPRQLMATTGR